MLTQTYAVGNSGMVRKLTNLTLPWVDVSVSPIFNFTGTLLDVETDPVNSDIVFAVGEVDKSEGSYGIFVSTDAGVTWNLPTGTYTIPGIGGNHTWYEVCVVNSSVIYVSGASGYVAVSYDGGLTFNLTGSRTPQVATLGDPTLQYRQNVSIHFITPLIGVIGSEDHIFSTVNGGNTWTVLNGGNAIVDGVTGIPGIIYSGIHLSQNQQVINAVGWHGVFRSTNAGLTFNMVYNFPSRNGRHLTWINDNELWATGKNNERIKSTNAGASWSVLSPFLISPAQDDLGAHFWTSSDGFFTENAGFVKTTFKTSNSGISGISSDSPVQNLQAVWTLYVSNCYRVENCIDANNYFYTSNDFSSVVGKTVTLKEFEGCWKVTQGQDCPPIFVDVTVSAIFTDCEQCQPVCYILSDCLGVETSIHSNSNLAQYVGQIVKIKDCHTCWLVSETTDCNVPQQAVVVESTYLTCQSCVPQPDPEPIVTVKPRKIDPGYSTKWCDPSKVESANCNFAEEVYRKMLYYRYGISYCCEDNFQAATLRKEIIDLELIYDPQACKNKTIITDCCAPCNVTAELLIFNQITCPAPELVSASLVIFGGPCVAPNNITAILDTF